MAALLFQFWNQTCWNHHTPQSVCKNPNSIFKIYPESNHFSLPLQHYNPSPSCHLSCITAITSQLMFLLLALFLFGLLSTQQIQWSFEKQKQDLITPLLKTLPWCPVSLRVKAKVPTTAYRALCHPPFLPTSCRTTVLFFSLLLFLHQAPHFPWTYQMCSP